jgi:hypothetical protein
LIPRVLGYNHLPMKWRIRLLIIFLFTILLISIGLNYYLFNLSLQYYRELNATRLDPLGLNHFSDPQEGANGIIAVFFGDSRAESWPPPNITGFEFINRGIGAQTTAQVIQRFDLHTAPLQPDIIIIQVGINDLKTIRYFPNK